MKPTCGSATLRRVLSHCLHACTSLHWYSARARSSERRKAMTTEEERLMPAAQCTSTCRVNDEANNNDYDNYDEQEKLQTNKLLLKLK
jgi:hypothetical protein